MSPIRGLTNRGPSFPEIGQIRKGEKGEDGRPVDLDYFRFVSDIPEVMEAFEEAYGKEPRLINVRFPHKTTDENWEAWNEEYIASGLVHRCDGEYVVRQREKDGTFTDPAPETVKCPYFSGEKERTKSHPGCKETGRLKVVIPELGRFAYVMVHTTSINDVPALDGQIRGLEVINGGDLRGIPAQLRRRMERISTPKFKKEKGEYVKTGDRVRRESWLLSVEAHPDYAQMRLETQRVEAMQEVRQIEAPPDVEEGDFTDVETPPVEELPEKLPEELPEKLPGVPFTGLRGKWDTQEEKKESFIKNAQSHLGMGEKEAEEAIEQYKDSVGSLKDLWECLRQHVQTNGTHEEAVDGELF